MDDLSSLKRKDLQKLAKKHGLKANAKNEDLIKELSIILKVQCSVASKDTQDSEIKLTIDTKEHKSSIEIAEKHVEQKQIATEQPIVVEAIVPVESIEKVEEPAYDVVEPEVSQPVEYESMKEDEERDEPAEEPYVSLYPALSPLKPDAAIFTITTTITAPTSLYPTLSIPAVEDAEESTSDEVTPVEEATSMDLTTDDSQKRTTTAPSSPTKAPSSKSTTKTPIKSTVKTPSKSITKTPSKPTTKTPSKTTGRTPKKAVEAAPAAEKDSRRQEVLQSRSKARAEEVKTRQAAKKSALSSVANKVSGANRPKPKVKAFAKPEKKEATKKKRIDFDKVHSKQFNSMASIAQHEKEKVSRALEFLGFARPASSIPTTTSDTTIPSESTAPSTSSTSIPNTPAVAPTVTVPTPAFAFKPPPCLDTTSASKTPLRPKPSTKPTTASKPSTTSKAITPAKPITTKPTTTPRPSAKSITVTTTTTTATTPAINRLKDTKRSTVTTIPAFVPPPKPEIPHFTANPVPSVKADENTESKTPKNKPKPVFSTENTPLKVSDADKKQPLSAKRPLPPVATITTPAPPTATEPSAKKSKPSYTPHTGPLPKFEANGFTSFNPSVAKAAAQKPKYDAKKSLASTKKTPKATVKKATENKENIVNSLAC